MNHPHLGDFYGLTLSQASRDAFVMRHIQPKSWNVLADLYGKKWYGYRFVDPSTTLFLFADRFRTAYMSAFGYSTPFGNIRQVNFMTKLRACDISAMFNAMCFADDYGIPYDFFCKTAIDVYSRTRGKRPMPNQIYSASVVWDVRKAWDERLADETLVQSNAPHYALKNFRDHPWQVSYQNFLLAQIAQRRNPKYTLARVLYEQPQVDEFRAIDRLGMDVVREAKLIASFA